jgi:hypothetical protein
MPRPKWGVTLLAAVVWWAGTGQAQERAALEVSRSLVQAERTALVAKNVPLTKDEEVAFWPLCNEYHEEIRRLNDRRATLIRQFADEYETLTDERALELVGEYQDFRKSRIELRKKYLKKFAKILSGKKTMRYYQVENKLDTIIDMDLVRGIPLAR